MLTGILVLVVLGLFPVAVELTARLENRLSGPRTTHSNE